MNNFAAAAMRQGVLVWLRHKFCFAAAALAVLALLPLSPGVAGGINFGSMSWQSQMLVAEPKHVDRNTEGARFRQAPVDRVMKHTGTNPKNTGKNSRSGRSGKSSSSKNSDRQIKRRAIRARKGQVKNCTIESTGVEVCP